MEMEEHLEMLNLVASEEFTLRAYPEIQQQKKGSPELVKRDMYGREAEPGLSVVCGAG